MGKKIFVGRIELYEQDDKGEYTKLVRTSPNLYVDDGKELTLDFLWGLKSWWNPLDQGAYTSDNIGWNTTRWVGFGACMFNNSSAERASGMNAIPSGSNCDYPVASTWLVEPEDSFLSREFVGSTRVALSCTRRDQTVEMSAIIDVPGDIPMGSYIREFGCFLSQTGPAHDPSYHDLSKPKAMICRASLFDTGWYCLSGGVCTPCASGTVGAILCYENDSYYATGQIQFRWVFGEL